MRNVKYTDSINFRCLEHLRESSLDISLLHAGKEQCAPLHICSKTRTEYVIHFVLSGKGFYTVGDRTWSLSAGDMFVIYPGETITYGSDSLDPWYYAWVGFTGIRSDAILRNCGFTPKKLVLKAPPSTENVMDCIDSILDCKALTFADNLKRESLLLLLFSKLTEYHAKLRNESGDKSHDYGSSAYVELAIDHIKSNYQDGINVSDIAEHIGISRAYLNHAFQKELGLSIQKFLIDFRMHKAASLLVSTMDSIKEISQAVGYEDQLAFSKAFKKKFGVSPKLYRTHKLKTIHYDEKQLTDNEEDFS